jgi:hypothetical protein
MRLFIGEFVLFVSLLVLVLFCCFRYLLFWYIDLCVYGLKIGLNGLAANTPDVVGNNFASSTFGTLRQVERPFVPSSSYSPSDLKERSASRARSAIADRCGDRRTHTG